MDLKIKHTIPLVVIMIFGFVVIKYVFNPKPIDQMKSNPSEGKKTHINNKILMKEEAIKKKEEKEKLLPEEKIERDIHIPPELLDITKFTKAEKHKEKEGCPVIEHCEHVQCPGPQYDRIIRFKEDGCRECVCVLE